MPKNSICEGTVDLTDEELMEMGFSEEEIDAAWARLIRDDMTRYYA